MLEKLWSFCSTRFKAPILSPIVLVGPVSLEDVQRRYEEENLGHRVFMDPLNKRIPGMEAGTWDTLHPKEAEIKAFEIVGQLVKVYHDFGVETVILLSSVLHLPNLLHHIHHTLPLRIIGLLDTVEGNSPAHQFFYNMMTLSTKYPRKTIGGTEVINPFTGKGYTSRFKFLPVLLLEELGQQLNLSPTTSDVILARVTTRAAASALQPITCAATPCPPPRKIAFLFMTYANHEAPQFWTDFFDKAPKSQYKIYVHSVHPGDVTDEFLRPNLLPHQVDTKWGNFVNGMVTLLRAALEDEENDRFAFCSQACIPVQPFEKMREMMATRDMWAEPGHSPAWIMEQRYRGLSLHAKALISYDQFRKNEFGTWSVYGRRQASIVSSGYLLHDFDLVEANDETYPGNMLALAGEPTWSYGRAATLVRWETSSSPHPVVYITSKPNFPKVYKAAKDSGYMFMRKVLNEKESVLGKSFDSSIDAASMFSW